MWYDYSVSAEPWEIVTIDDARRQARTEAGDGHDEELAALITVARLFVQKVTGLLIGAQTIVVKCDSFADMCRLPVAPVSSVTSITYLDADGAAQTLATSVYELRAESLDPAIVLKFNQSWPSIQPGSRITLTAVAGSDEPEAPLVHAMLLKIGEMFGNHEPAGLGEMSTVDALLINYRRNA
jgi:uncharacterized phiE125 gp8 family phage protein